MIIAIMIISKTRKAGISRAELEAAEAQAARPQISAALAEPVKGGGYMHNE
jgi:hypothetical protein